jgi:hypothetical protein
MRCRQALLHEQQAISSICDALLVHSVFGCPDHVFTVRVDIGLEHGAFDLHHFLRVSQIPGQGFQ